ncbi:alpha/beta fold hydrolase [Mycobacterium sp. NPDC050853]|uniref:thioesterase II family protein n=1 Tax=Mycobacterium sp. NPDC050853 TaxID=3155160 RepID=UPI0033FD5B14
MPAGLPVLFCLAGAGGGPLEFARWPAAFAGKAAVVPIALPGRERRISEPIPSSVTEVANQIISAASSFMERPFVLYGHSLGALLMYEVAALLPPELEDNLHHLVVGAQQAPQWPQVYELFSTRTDDQLIEYLRNLGGTDEEILNSAAFMKPYLSCLRADMAIAESYRYRGPAALPCPVSVLIGTDDTEVQPGHLSDWAQETRAGSNIVTLPGGHFNLRTHSQNVITSLLSALPPTGAATGPKASPPTEARR